MRLKGKYIFPFTKDGRGYRQKLSAQEVLVLDLLLAEKSVKEIAQELQMAEKESTQSSSACRIRWEAEGS